MPRGVAKAKDGVEKKGKEVGKKDDGKKGVVKRNRKMRGGDEIFYHKIQGFITKNTPIFKEKKEAIIKVLNVSMIGYNNSIGRSLTPSRLDFNKSSRFKNTLKATISYLNAIGNISTIEPTLVKFPLYPVANELADVLLDILDNKDIMKDIEQRNDLILQFIYIKIFILFTEFKYFCDRINYIKEYNIVEAPQVEGVAELATLTAAKKAVEAELATANAAKNAVDAELATTQKLLQNNDIITINNVYFENAFKKAQENYRNGLLSKAKDILNNISGIWNMLKDDSSLKKDKKIIKIMKDVIVLNENITDQDEFEGGGKRKKISSRTKRK